MQVDYLEAIAIQTRQLRDPTHPVARSVATLLRKDNDCQGEFENSLTVLSPQSSGAPWRPAQTKTVQNSNFKVMIKSARLQAQPPSEAAQAANIVTARNPFRESCASSH